jgi:hypothetical protein
VLPKVSISAFIAILALFIKQLPDIFFKYGLEDLAPNHIILDRYLLDRHLFASPLLTLLFRLLFRLIFRLLFRQLILLLLYHLYQFRPRSRIGLDLLRHPIREEHTH